MYVPDEIRQHESRDEEGDEEHRHASFHPDHVFQVVQRGELHGDRDRHEGMACLIAAARQHERGYDGDEHDEVRAVLDIYEPIGS
jgi:hypothetical protein